MGAKSTISITRDRALNFIVDVLSSADNETLARIVEDLNDELFQKGNYENSLGLHNFYVTHDSDNKFFHGEM